MRSAIGRFHETRPATAHDGEADCCKRAPHFPADRVIRMRLAIAGRPEHRDARADEMEVRKPTMKSRMVRRTSASSFRREWGPSSRTRSPWGRGVARETTGGIMGRYAHRLPRSARTNRRPSVDSSPRSTRCPSTRSQRPESMLNNRAACATVILRPGISRNSAETRVCRSRSSPRSVCMDVHTGLIGISNLRSSWEQWTCRAIFVVSGVSEIGGCELLRRRGNFHERSRSDVSSGVAMTERRRRGVERWRRSRVSGGRLRRRHRLLDLDLPDLRLDPGRQRHADL
jgi:hypothetical protein